MLFHTVSWKRMFSCGDHGDLFAQRANRHVADVDAVDANAAGGGVVEARDQIYERGFSGAAGADQRDHFAALRAQANVLKYVDCTGVAKS